MYEMFCATCGSVAGYAKEDLLEVMTCEHCPEGYEEE